MKKIFVLLAVVAMVCVPTMAFGQFYDDFDSYTAGATIPAGNDWVGWGGPAYANCIVTAGPAYSGRNSLAADGAAPDTDQVAEFGYDPKTGKWLFSVQTYVPSNGKAGNQYFNLMNKFDQGTNTYDWSNVEVTWTMVPGDALVDQVYLQDNQAGALPIAYDQWVQIVADIDLDANTVAVTYGGTSLGSLAWTDGTVQGIDVMDIFPIIPSDPPASVMYYDDVSLQFIPEPASLALLGLGGLMVLRRKRR